MTWHGVASEVMPCAHASKPPGQARVASHAVAGTGLLCGLRAYGRPAAASWHTALMSANGSCACIKLAQATGMHE